MQRGQRGHPETQAIWTTVNWSAGASREGQQGAKAYPPSTSFTLTLPRRTDGERGREGMLEKEGETMREDFPRD